MATFGEIRFRLVKAFPGLDPDLIDGWINDRYTEILDRLNWSRQRRSAVIQTSAPYRAGTVTVSAGSADVALADGTWTAAMSGWRFRIDGESAYYTFTQTGETAGTLDRPYQGEAGEGSTYTLWQAVYDLPDDARLAVDVRGLDRNLDLRKLSLAELNSLAPARGAIGTPQAWVPALDDASDPPRATIEVYPAPDAALALPVDYEAEESVLGRGNTGVSLKPWARPGCLVAGASADAANHLERFSAADRHEARFEALLEQMIAEEARRDGPKTLKMADRYTDHRLLRALRGVRNPRRR